MNTTIPLSRSIRKGKHDECLKATVAEPNHLVLMHNFIKSTILAATFLLFGCAADNQDPESISYSYNENITYGSIHDARDGKTYRTVTIGDQVWMADNLSYNNTSSILGGTCGSAKECAIYGRFYQWTEVMTIDAKYADSLYYPNSAPQGLCPLGFQIPTAADYYKLINTVENDSSIGKGNGAGALKSMNGWERTHLDKFGFRALPSGYFEVGMLFSRKFTTYFYTLTQDPDGFQALALKIEYDSNEPILIRLPKEFAASVRCIQRSSAPQQKPS